MKCNLTFPFSFQRVLLSAICCLPALAAQAKTDLVTLPRQDSIQLTIYNHADLTLARDTRQLTLREGTNRLQFSWANTLIDPTSLDLNPLQKAADIDIQQLIYPPRTERVGIWNIISRTQGKIPMEITYLTSGLSWRAFYMATLNQEETAMHLQGYVRVTNTSGEDYENAQTRLIVGQVHLLDQIAELARRTYPYGRPNQDGAYAGSPEPPRRAKNRALKNELMLQMDVMAMPAAAPKEIIKQGLSEYFLYTIEGTETIPDGWSKRLPSFKAVDIPVSNRYKYEQERYGSQVMRLLSFVNDKKHQLGTTPIPGGDLKVFRSLDAAGHLSYEGQSAFKYIPVDEDVELNLGASQKVLVDVDMMNEATRDYVFDRKGNVSGWIQDLDYELSVNNTRPIPITIEITRNMNAAHWTLTPAGAYDSFKIIDKDTARFTLTVPPRTKKTFTYRLTIRYGRQAE